MAVQRVRTKMQQLLFVSVSILVFAGDCGSSLDVSSSHFGTFDFAELEQVQYDLEISGSPIPERIDSSNSNSRGGLNTPHVSFSKLHSQNPIPRTSYVYTSKWLIKSLAVSLIGLLNSDMWLLSIQQRLIASLIIVFTGSLSAIDCGIYKHALTTADDSY